jgi:gamma-glutamylcyclotransferase (GGCT)/AIG2-like uncharacterized protein YtfP
MSREASMISSRLPGRDSLLFVYGTLRPFVAIPMARWLAAEARYVGPARTRGRLYDLGPYPAMRAPVARRQWVVGDVYQVASPRVLRVLDLYEAGASAGRPQFARVPCTVAFARGAPRAAWVYLYQPRVRHAPRIVGGDYRRHLERAGRAHESRE